MKKLNKMSPRAICEEVVSNQDLKLKIANNMIMHGGSFAKSLSGCILLADATNLRKLCDAFLNYILQYEPSKWENRSLNI